jgi:hypothetical protein
VAKERLAIHESGQESFRHNIANQIIFQLKLFPKMIHEHVQILRLLGAHSTPHCSKQRGVGKQRANEGIYGGSLFGLLPSEGLECVLEPLEFFNHPGQKLGKGI